LRIGGIKLTETAQLPFFATQNTQETFGQLLQKRFTIAGPIIAMLLKLDDIRTDQPIA
jgi:hypothetical protein